MRSSKCLSFYDRLFFIFTFFNSQFSQSEKAHEKEFPLRQYSFEIFFFLQIISLFYETMCVNHCFMSYFFLNTFLRCTSLSVCLRLFKTSWKYHKITFLPLFMHVRSHFFFSPLTKTCAFADILIWEIYDAAYKLKNMLYFLFAFSPFALNET